MNDVAVHSQRSLRENAEGQITKASTSAGFPLCGSSVSRRLVDYLVTTQKNESRDSANDRDSNEKGKGGDTVSQTTGVRWRNVRLHCDFDLSKSKTKGPVSSARSRSQKNADRKPDAAQLNRSKECVLEEAVRRYVCPRPLQQNCKFTRMDIRWLEEPDKYWSELERCRISLRTIKDSPQVHPADLPGFIGEAERGGMSPETWNSRQVPKPATSHFSALARRLGVDALTHACSDCAWQERSGTCNSSVPLKSGYTVGDMISSPYREQQGKNFQTNANRAPPLKSVRRNLPVKSGCKPETQEYGAFCLESRLGHRHAELEKEVIKGRQPFPECPLKEGVLPEIDAKNGYFLHTDSEWYKGKRKYHESAPLDKESPSLIVWMAKELLRRLLVVKVTVMWDLANWSDHATWGSLRLLVCGVRRGADPKVASLSKKAKSTEGCNRPKAPTAPWGQVKSPTQPIEHTKEARGVRGGEEDFNIVILSMYKLQRQDEDEQLREFCKLNFLEVLRCLRSMRTVNWQHCTDGRLCRDGLSYLAFFLVMTVRGDTRLTLPPCHPPHDFILPSACIKVTSSGNSYTMQPTEVQHKQQKPPGAFTSFKDSDASVEQRSAAVSVSTPNADVRPKQLSADVSAAGTATATAQNLLFTPSAQAVSAVPKNASDNKSNNEACPEKLATLEPKAIQAKTPATQSCESSPFKRELNLKTPQQRLQQLTSLSHPPPSQNPPPTSLTSDHPASKKEASGGNNESDSEGEAFEEKGPDSATVEIPEETPCALCQLKDMAVNFVLTRDPDLRVRLCNSVIYQACVDERYNCWQRTPTVQRYTGTHRAHRRRRPRRNVKHRISRHHSGSEGKALSRAKTRAHSMFQIPLAAAEAGGMTSSSQSNDDPSTNLEALECPTSDNPPESGTNPSRTIDSWENSDFRRTSSSNSTCFDKKTGSKDSSFKNTNFTSGHCVIQRTVLAETQTLCRNKVPVRRKAGEPTRWYHVKRKKNNFCYFLKVLMRRSGQNLSVKPSRRGKRSRIFLAPYSGDVRVRRTNEKKRHRKKVASSCEQLSRALKARNKTGRVKIIAQRTILKSRRKMSNTPQVQGVLRINARDSDAEQKQYDREIQTETANYNQGIGRTVSLAGRNHVAEWGMQPADERALTMKVTTRLNKAMLGLSCGGHTLGSEFTDFDHCDDIMASRHVSPMDMSSPGVMDRNVKGTDSNSNDSSTSSSETDVTTTFLGQNPIRRGVNLSLALFCKNELHRSCVALNCNSLSPTRPTAKDVGKDEDILHINKDEAKWVPDDGSEEVSKTMPSLTPHQQLIIRKQQLRPSKLTMQMSEMADASIPCINNTNPSRGQHSRDTDHKTIRVHPGPPVLSRLHRLHNPPRLLSYRNSRKSKPSMGIQSGEPIRPTVSQRIQAFPLLQANFCLRGQSIRKAKSLSKLDSRHKDGPSQLRHAVSRPPPQHFVRQTTRPKAGTVILQSAGGSTLTHTKAIPFNQNFCKAKISKKPQENSPYLSSFLMVDPPPSWK